MASYDSSNEQEKKKHSNRRTAGTKSSQDTTYKPVYHRRRKTKHTLKAHSVHKDQTDCAADDRNDCEDEISLRCKSKQYEREKCRLNEGSNIPKETFVEGIISSSLRDKHVSKDALRVANEYHKLEKRYKSIQEECQKLSSLLEQRELEYRRVCSHYEALMQMVQELEKQKVALARQNQKLMTEKVQSDEDITLLKSIVYQLNTELERYQDKLRDQKPENVSTHAGGSREQNYDQRIWGSVHFHALGPLLNAYQENLSEKQELIHMYEKEMSDFGSRCKEILTENELMHKEVEVLRSECDRYAKEIKTLVENTASLKNHHDILKKETAELKREANDIRSSYELKMEVILRRNEMLKKELATNATELSNLRGKYEILSKEFEKVRNKEGQTVPTIVHTTAIEECKMLLDELKSQYESEKRNLCSHIKRIEEIQPENEKQLIMVIAERNHLKGLVENLETNLKRTQRKIEQMQTLVYSTRVSRNSLKEQLGKATTYCEELFSEYERIVAEREKLLALLRETEKENANMDRLGKNITHRMEGLKNQLEIVRKGTKQQVDSVEKRIKLQELQMRRMKRDYRNKMQYLNDTIKQKEAIIEKLQKEKQTSENNSATRVSQPVNNEESRKQQE
ncbi:Protein Cep89 homolog [Anthophora plagiata]